MASGMTKKFSVELSTDDREALIRKADKLRVSAARYARIVLERHLKKGEKLILTED